MKVRYHIYKDVKIHQAGTSDEEIVAAANKKIQHLRYSFVSSAYHHRRQMLYLGTTSFAGDILVAFDPKKEKFQSLKAHKSGILSPLDVKIHKGLTLDEKNDKLYFATAALSGISGMIETAGGIVVSYDIAKNKFESLGHPVKGDFYQSACFDLKRKLAYLFTARLAMVIYDYGKRKLLRYECMESVPHNSCIDKNDCVWGTHSAGSHKFFRFNPKSKKFEFPNFGFPNAAMAANIQYPGAGPVDSMLNGPDGFIYTSNAFGELYRIDPDKDRIEYLGKPFAQRRMPAMAMGEDGWLYLSGGHRPISMLARYSINERRFEYLGEIRHTDGTWMEYVHEINVVSNKVYALETDNVTRNGYLWECTI
jgi:hypothetical protein